ncbi:MAG: hypothetical protein IT445_04050 [Phycisphaeraceae bacterium]|nr:hypothetical protein [Phycisphaeraceae bacterium]
MVRPIGEQRRAKLLMELIKGEKDVVEIAQEYRLSLSNLIYWVRLPENWTVLADVARLNDAQTRLQLSRYRRHGLWKLAALLSSTKSNKEDDVMRRASVDLLKAAPGLKLLPGPQDEAGDDANDSELTSFFAQMSETREQLKIAGQRQHLDAQDAD